MHEYKYKTYRKIYKKVALEAEITYYKELIYLRKNSTKELWANLNKLPVYAVLKNSGAHQMVLKIVVNKKYTFCRTWSLSNATFSFLIT